MPSRHWILKSLLCRAVRIDKEWKINFINLILFLHVFIYLFIYLFTYLLAGPNPDGTSDLPLLRA